MGTVNHYCNGVDSQGGYNVIPTQCWETGGAYSYTIPGDIFHDSATNPQSLTYSANNAAWLNYSSTSRTFTPKLTPPATTMPPSYAGKVSNMTVTVSTPNDGTDSLPISIRVAPLGGHVPNYPDATVPYSVPADAANGDHFLADGATDAALTASDADNNLEGYRVIQPAGITLPFDINSSGFLYVSDNTKLSEGATYDAILEAYDNSSPTPVMDQCYVTVSVTAASGTAGKTLINGGLNGRVVISMG
jgi:hypothetical protein